jgi:MFS family permease
VIPLRLIRGGAFGIMNLFNFLFGAAALGFGTLVPLYAQDRYGVSDLSAGTLLTARAIGMIGIAAAASFALRRTGYRLPMVVGSAVVACGLGLMALHPVFGSPYLWLALGALVTGLGMGVSVPATNNAVLNLAPDQTAAISGLRGMFRQAGAITGISVATAIIAQSAAPGLAMSHVFAVFALIVLATIPLAYRVPDHRGTW